MSEPRPTTTVAEPRPAVEPTGAARSTRLISASLVMAAGTALSRVLGFGRLMLLVLLFGNGTRQAEIFTLANTVPNSMYILLAGGVLNTVLVPQLVRAIKHDPDRGEAYTNRVMTAGLVVLAGITVALTLAVPWIIALYTAPGWKSPALAPQYHSMVMLGYYCMPQVFFYGVHVLAGQVLNARDRFGPMMWAPIANNVVSIAVLCVFWAVLGPTDPSQAFSAREELLLGLGSTVGIAVQAAVLVPFLRAVGYRFRPRFDWRQTGLGHTLTLAKWTLGFVLVTQAALVVVNRLATRATVGGSGAGLAAYNYAHAMWILPHSLITVSLATAMLPSASRMAAAGDLAGVRDELLRTMRLALAVLLPAAVAFLALGVPISRLVFGFGQGARDADFVGWALMALAVGLVPFTLQYLCLRAFYALEDTRSTFFLQLFISAANVALAIGVVTLLDRSSLVAAGLGMAYSAAYLLGVVVSFSWLKRKLPGLRGSEVGGLTVRLLVAAAPAGVVAFWICFAFEWWSRAQAARLLGLVVAGVVAVGVFLLLSRTLRIGEVTDILRTLRRRPRVAATGPYDHGPNDRGPNRPAGDWVSRTEPGPSSIGPAPIVAPTATEPADPDRNAESMLTQAGPSRPGVPFRDEPRVEVTGVVGPGEPTGAVDDDTGADPATEPARPRSTLPAGSVLGSRYRMEELLAQSHPAVTWRAFDLVLSRSVLVHLLPPGDEAAPVLLAAARQASVATDSRFLRVLDAVHSDDPETGSYIVCEYATGQSLELILSSGPLSGLESAWVVREVADALAGVHSLGLYHERLSPDSVIITPTGNVKIVGLLIEAALRPRPLGRGEPVGPGLAVADTPERADVVDLGRLLYAALVARWPGSPAFGLPDAPLNGQRVMTPRQVRAGVSPALDAICDQILSDSPRHRTAPVSTAAGVVAALTKVLGNADAAGDLERRLRQPVPRVRPGADPVTPVSPLLPAPTRVAPATAATARTAAASAPVAGPAPARTQTSSAPAGRGLEGDETVVRPAVRTSAGAAAGTARSARRWVVPLVLLSLLLIGGGVLAAVVWNNQRVLPGVGGPGSSSSPGDPSPPGAGAVLAVRDVQDFDPQGDDGTENPDEVERAVDGDRQTRWRTLEYKGNPELGGLKRGVGLVLDLGSAQPVRTVELSLSGNRTDVEVRVPRSDPESTAKAPLSSDRRWRAVAEEARAGETAKLELEEPVTTRFLLVYLTSLPKEGNGYRGGIYEVQVRS